MTYLSAEGTTCQGGLSKDDLDAITRSTTNISDIPASSLARFEAGFKHAYYVASLITDGLKDPLSR